MSTNFIDGNVIIVPLLEFIKRYPDLIQTINIIGESCGHGGLGNPYISRGDVYIAMYIDYGTLLVNPQNPLTALEQVVNNTSTILGYLIMVKYENFAEIYDVCTLPSHRRRGVMSTILTAVQYYSSSEIWVGVRFDNPNFYNTINFYIKNGFTNPRLSNRTGYRVTTGFYHISLQYSPDPAFTKVEDPYITVKILEKIYTESCPYLLMLDILTVRRIYRDFVNHPNVNTEYSGVLRTERRGRYTALVLDSIPSQGSAYDPEKPDAFVAPIQDSPFVFHTHPPICYRSNNCVLGWPSGMDMVYTLSQENILVHFVFTIEGIYTIQVTPTFKYMYSKLSPSCRRYVDSAILLLFGESELERGSVEDENIVTLFSTRHPFFNSDPSIRYTPTSPIYTRVSTPTSRRSSFRIRQTEPSKSSYLRAANEITMNDLFKYIPDNVKSDFVQNCIDSAIGDYTLFVVTLMDPLSEWDLVLDNVVAYNMGRECP